MKRARHLNALCRNDAVEKRERDRFDRSHRRSADGAARAHIGLEGAFFEWSVWPGGRACSSKRTASLRPGACRKIAGSSAARDFMRAALASAALLFLGGTARPLAAQSAAGVYRELYFNLNRESFSLGRLTNHPNFLLGKADQTNILTSGLSTELNRGDDYGQRLRAYLTAPATGNYIFSIASDETSNLFLSTDEDPLHRELIAWVDPRSQPGNYTTHFGQQSASIGLQAGQRYYLEVIHHEANLIDTLTVQWRLPSGATENPIPNSRLAYEIPPTITASLTNLIVEEGRSVAFAPQMANFLPQSFRWQRDGADLPGATNDRYEIASSSLSDHGAVFRAFITNRFGMTNTAEAQLTVLPDTNAPIATRVLNANRTNIFVTFSEPVTSTSALALANYQLSGAALLHAELGPELGTVILTTAPLTMGSSYTLSISNVLDRASMANLLAPTQLVFTAREFNPHGVGHPAQPGNILPFSGDATVTGGGSGIDAQADQFLFGWQAVSGNFDFRVRLNAIEFTDLWAKAGLMARETLGADSRFAAALVTPSLAGCLFQHRTNTGGRAASGGSFPPSFPSMWLRLQRADDLFSGFASQDGEIWTRLGSVTLALPDRIYFGYAVTSRNTNQTTSAVFSDFSSAASGSASAVPPRTEPLGPSSRRTGLVISEIMYHPKEDTGQTNANLEFVELFNSNPFYEDISGYRLTGDVEYTFPPGTILPGGSLVVVAADPFAVEDAYKIENVFGPFTNSLPNDRGNVGLRNNNDHLLLEVDYDSRHAWPVAADGAGHSLALARPSYGENQREAWAASDAIGGSPGRPEPVSVEPLRAVLLNELLAHTDEPLLDFIELHNQSRAPVDVGGAWLTDNPATNKFQIPLPTIIPPGGFVSFDQNQLGFSLSSGGERILFVNSSQTRVLDALRFEAQANGISLGRSPDGAPAFQELSARSPGARNSPPLIRDIVINEIMYHPISEDDNDEFIELFNKGPGAIDLGDWRFTDGVDFRFPSNTVVTPGAYLVVAKNRTNLLARHPNLASNPILVVGDYDGMLANDRERLALAMPELAINADNPSNVTTNVIYVVADEVEYRDGGQWGHWSDGGGSSLELIDPRADNRLAPNWADSDETGKAPWTTIETTGVLDNGGDAADSLHVMLLEEGECLFDDVEVMPQGSGNRIANGTFEPGLGGWTMRGTHERSSLEESGFNSARSMHIRASAQGDIGPNKLRVPFTSNFASGQTATIRAKARWLRGWPELLLRIRGSYLEAAGRLIVPGNLGTPGAPNSRLAANAGPAITATVHAPAVPAANEAVVVTTRVTDTDGLGSVALRYRIDPSPNLATVMMNDAGMNGDALAEDGVYSAIIPGHTADTMVAFIIEATDAGTTPVASRFPALRDDNGPVRECLIHFGSLVPAGSFGTYRFWITQSSITNWSRREVLSNERLPGTFVYGNQRVVYDAGGRYSGSAAHQDQAAPDYSPVLTPNNYTIDVPKDDLVLGTDNFNKIHGAGNNHHDDNTLLREVTAYWMAQRLGLPANYKRFAAMFINGARRGTLMEDTQVPNNDVLEGVFPEDSEGDLYKVSVWYEFANATSPALGFTGVSEAYLNNYTTTGGAKKRARYRWNWQPRALNGTANDFANLFLLVDAANTPAGAAFEQNMNALADMENWMRTFALEHALGNWDSFGYRNQQNMFAYKPERDRWKLLIWDINIIFGGGTRGTPVATNGDLFEIDGGDQSMPKIYSTPAYRRIYWQALKEIAESSFVNANADPFLDARFDAFSASGVDVTPPDLIKVWISQRRAYILSELAKVDAADFTVSGPLEFLAQTNLIVLSGLAPLDVYSVEVNGTRRPVTWVTLTNWTLRLPLAEATNELTILARDRSGQIMLGASNRIIAVYTGSMPLPEEHITINEIHYDPLTPESSFVELFNRSSHFTFDLAGWRLNGLDFTFPQGAFITNGQFLVIAKNRNAFALAHGVSNYVAGEFQGQLDRGGETLTLFRPIAAGVSLPPASPATAESDFVIVDRVKYDDDPPWPTAPAGTGPSLQLIDAAQDNSRAGNWAGEAGWVFVSRRGNIGTATNLLLWIQGVGNAYIDDVALIGPEGTNIVLNGGFEADLSPIWLLPANASSSVIVETASRSGQRSLFFNADAPGGSGIQSLQQRLTGRVSTNTTYTLSFWCLSHTNSVSVNARTLPGNSLTMATLSGRVLATPGAPSAFAEMLPAFPPVWLNEVQTRNTTGVLDGQNEREPWLELFNAGPDPLSLDGLYLSANYSNLTEWAFPSGSTLAPGEFKIIWTDAEPLESTVSEWHTSFRLSGAAGSVALARIHEGAPQVLDYFNYPTIGADLSYGALPNGQPFDRRVLYRITPGASNAAPPAPVFINEWMAANTRTLADPADGDFEDWFELFNAGEVAIDLSGFYLSDTPENPTKFRIPSGNVIPAGGFLLVWADEETAQNSSDRIDLHVNFRLSTTGEAIALYMPSEEAVDEIEFHGQTNDVSEGRFADGAETIYFMPVATPRGANRLSSGNMPPELAPIADRIITAGQTLAITVSATDADVPAQSLHFALEGTIPLGAAIHSTTGLFRWDPTVQQAPSTNVLTVRVTDNGVPPLSAMVSFGVRVAPPPRLAPIAHAAAGTVRLAWEAIPGKVYRVEFKNDLGDAAWIPLGQSFTAPAAMIEVDDDLGTAPHRFYRLLILD